MKTIPRLPAAFLLTAALLTSTASAQDFTFSTIAGGSAGFLDGLDTNARFNDPVAVAVDNSGNLYIADRNNDAVREITPVGTNWVVTTLAGGTQGSQNGNNNAAQFFDPSGIAVDSSGTLYVADSFNSTIRQIVRSGANWVVTTIAGSPGLTGLVDGINSAARFTGPTGIAVDASGALYVGDQGNNCIRKITRSGANWTTTTIAGGTQGYSDGTNSDAQFFSPSGVAVDGTGRVFVADLFNNSIRLLTPSGANWVVTTIAGNSVAGRADGIGTNAEFNAPAGVAVDAGGDVYVVDLYNDAVRKMTLAGGNWTVTTVAGGTQGSADGTGASAQFNLPFGVAADAYGDVFVADSQNNAIRLGFASGSPAPTGALQVEITPGGAGTAGARWQLDGGANQTSGTLVADLSPGSHTLTFTSAAGYTTPAGQTIPVTARQTNVITVHYTAAAANSGSLQVLLSPSGAVSAGAMWLLDGGAPQTNGAILAAVSVGIHTVSFETIPGWTSPASQSITITNAQTTLAQATYVKQQGSLEVSILPANVVTAGAKWEVDGGLLQASGTTLSGLTPGIHTLSFNTVLGWSTPVEQQVTITNNQTTTETAIYVEQIAGTGSLQVTLLPPGASAAGAQWQLDGGPAMASSATVSSLAPGLHSLTFTTIPGWITPVPQQVTAVNGQTTLASATYVQEAVPTDLLQITILPAGAVAAGAEWQVDGGTFQASGASVANLTPGIHTVAFNNVSGWVSPTQMLVTIVAGQTNALFDIYHNTTDRTKPVVTITSPSPKLRLTNAQLIVEGKASSKAGLDQVLYQINNGGYLPATGTTNWSAVITLAPGNNVFMVEAVADSGNVSTALSDKLDYIVTSPLTVTTNGSGKVTPVLNGQYLTVGASYTLSATPNSGNLFAGWTGSLNSNSPVLRFLMQSNMVLQANFITNPFIPQQGVFNGLFLDTNNVTLASSGDFTLTLRSTGAFSVAIQTAGGRSSGIGQFDLTGHALAHVGSLVADLQLDFGNHLSGTISTANWSAGLTADLAVFNSGNNKAENYLGQYTMVIPGTGDGSLSPGGYGYATVSVNVAGGIVMAGSLADGSAISQSATVNGDGQWPLFAPFSGGGAIFGWITFSNQPASTLGGTLNWIRPAGRIPKLYPGGFTNLAPVTGSSYHLTRGVPVIVLDAGQAMFSGLPLETPLTTTATITAGSALVVAPGTNHISLSLRNGVISGSFRFPGTGAVTPVGGVILQQQNQALGYFLGTTEAGTFQLQ